MAQKLTPRQILITATGIEYTDPELGYVFYLPQGSTAEVLIMGERTVRVQFRVKDMRFVMTLPQSAFVTIR